MKRYLFLCLILFFTRQLMGQTLRPDVLVIGNNNAAVAAAIQSAQSNAKTILLLQAGGFDISTLDKDIHSGIQAKFLERQLSIQVKSISSLGEKISQPPTQKQMANEVMTKWTDSLKNLTVIKNVYWEKAARSGKRWVFKLADGKIIRPEVLVNVADEKLNTALKINASGMGTWFKLTYENTLYKTNVAAGRNIEGATNTAFSLYQLLMPEQENLVYVNDPSSMLLGQAAGAVAAYAGFFNIHTSASNLKVIQGELIAHQANLMPFSDIHYARDTNWRAIQMVAITGVLKGIEDKGHLVFRPDSLITTEEIKQPIKDHYYKAQIWFDDHKSEIITIGDALNMICYVGNKALASTQKEVAKKWKTIYAFPSEFDLERQISRRELSVLLHDYMPPFNITIDKYGKILR